MCAPTIYNESTPKARRVHKCCECQGEIQKGEVYHKVQGMWEGDWGSFKHCPECWELYEKIHERLRYAGRSSDELCLGELALIILEDASKFEVKTYMEIRKKRNAPESRKRWIELRAEKILGKEGASHGE